MEIINNILINSMHVILPFMIYLFYIAYKNVDDEREDKLAIIITIFSSMYICLKFNKELLEGLPLILINTPLLISYYKKNNIAILVSSIIIVLYSYNFYSAYLYILIIEYILYCNIYKLLLKKTSINIYIITFSLIKTLFMMIMLNLELKNTINNYLEIIFLGLVLCIVTIIIINLEKKAEDIIKINMLAKETLKEKQIRKMLFQITHEIKNPIAVCKGYLDMFDTNNKDHAKKYIPIMKEEVNKVLILLEDFLSMNKVKLKKDILDINLLLEETINSFKLFWDKHNIKTFINIIDDEIYINGDYNRLRQVFLNIIKNSMEALKENPIIEIKTEIKNNDIYIYFKDNGSGIPKDILEKIKEPFFTTKSKGTGLGVPLSIEIIEGHDGKIEYESKEGEYTLVTIALPIIEI